MKYAMDSFTNLLDSKIQKEVESSTNQKYRTNKMNASTVNDELMKCIRSDKFSEIHVCNLMLGTKLVNCKYIKPAHNVC